MYLCGTERLMMNNYKKVFKDYKLFPKEEYRKTNLPEKEKKMLCEDGLPDVALHFFHFNIQRDELVIVNDNCISIGSDNGTEICINSNNEIVSVDTYGVYPQRFVNSSLEQFFECVAIYLIYSDRLMSVDDDEIGVLVGEIKQKFIHVDERTLNDEDNWWSVILEQVEDGLA